MRNEGWFCHFLGLPCYAYGFRYGKIATRKKPIDRLDPNPLLSPNHPSTDDACEPPPQMKSAETQRRLREQMKRLAEEKAANAAAKAAAKAEAKKKATEEKDANAANDASGTKRSHDATQGKGKKQCTETSGKEKKQCNATQETRKRGLTEHVVAEDLIIAENLKTGDDLLYLLTKIGDTEIGRQIRTLIWKKGGGQRGANTLVEIAWDNEAVGTRRARAKLKEEGGLMAILAAHAEMPCTNPGECGDCGWIDNVKSFFLFALFRSSRGLSTVFESC